MEAIAMIFGVYMIGGFLCAVFEDVGSGIDKIMESRSKWAIPFQAIICIVMFAVVGSLLYALYAIPCWLIKDIRGY